MKTRKPWIPRAGQPLPPVVALKQLLARDAALRDELHSALSSLSGADWRALVKDKTGISLSSDSKVTNLRQWFADWEAQEQFNAEMEQEELRLTQTGLPPEQVRAHLIAKTMARADAEGDNKTVLQAVDRAQTEQDLARKERELAVKAEALAQAERKLKLLEAKAAAYDRAQAALNEAKDAGGITPETQAKIERELRLL